MPYFELKFYINAEDKISVKPKKIFPVSFFNTSFRAYKYAEWYANQNDYDMFSVRDSRQGKEVGAR